MTAVNSARVAVITGAGSGIGQAVSVALAAQGFSIVLAGRTSSRLDAVVKEVQSRGAAGLAVPTDVRDPTQVAALFAAVDAFFGRIDLLFNNAGVAAPSVPLEELQYEQWRAVVDTSITGTFLCTQQAVRRMRNQRPTGGRIINNGSVAAQSPRPNSAAYAAAKHAITGLTKATSLDGRAANIACGQIDIGNADTDILENIDAGSDAVGMFPAVAPDRSRRFLQSDGEIRREPFMSVDHVVQAILTMASLPLEANIQSLTIVATAMPLIGRG